MVAAEGCAANASAFGLPLRTSPALAALLNGTSAHAFQLDEIHLESTLHPGSLALPAAFSLAEVDRTAGGRDLITAIVAGSQAAGLMAVQDGAMTKSFHSGRAAQSGVYAAQLARLGYTGIPDVLEADYGAFFSSFVDEWSEPELTAELGTRWHILRV